MEQRVGPALLYQPVNWYWALIISSLAQTGTCSETGVAPERGGRHICRGV